MNSAPLTAAGLRGKGELVDVWDVHVHQLDSYLPYLRAWNRDYAGLGLVVIGVHSPEFELVSAPRTSTVGFATTG